MGTGGKMAIKNAEEATERVKAFVEKFTALGFIPRCATKKNGVWQVEGMVGFTRMGFEVDAKSGEILTFCECK